MFETEMRETGEGRVTIDAQPATLKKMLGFVYTGQPPKLGDALEGIRLLEASALYQVDALKVCASDWLNCVLFFFVFSFLIPKNYFQQQIKLAIALIVEKMKIAHVCV
jgi:hypothetical protein